MTELVDEAVTPSAVSSVTAIHTYRNKGHTREKVLDLMQLKDRIDDIILIAIFGCVYFAITVISATAFLAFRATFKTKMVQFAKNLIQTLWQVYSLVLDQEHFKMSFLFSKVIWSLMNVAVLFFLFGFLINVMSSDIVVVERQKRINSVDDFFDSDLAYVEPTALMEFWYFEHLKTSAQDSKLRAIYDKINQKSECHSDYKQCKVFAGSMPWFEIVIERIRDADSNYTLLFPKEIFDHFLKPILCVTSDQNFDTTQLHSSKNAIVEDLQVYFMNKRRSDLFKRFTDFKLRAHLEFGMNVLESYIGELYVQNNHIINTKAEMCILDMTDVDQTMGQTPIAKITLKLQQLHQTACLCAIMMFLAMTTLLFELVLRIVKLQKPQSTTTVLFTRPHSQIEMRTCAKSTM